MRELLQQIDLSLDVDHSCDDYEAVHSVEDEVVYEDEHEDEHFLPVRTEDWLVLKESEEARE